MEARMHMILISFVCGKHLISPCYFEIQYCNVVRPNKKKIEK